MNKNRPRPTELSAAADGFCRFAALTI